MRELLIGRSSALLVEQMRLCTIVHVAVHIVMYAGCRLLLAPPLALLLVLLLALLLVPLMRGAL
jgi:hypothetical protein